MDEIMFADGLISEEDLAHYGVPRKSGRYPWGSGENPYHHGASSPFGRLKERRAQKKAAKAKAERTRKAQEAKAAKAEYERKKAEALKSGSAQQIAPYLRDLSDNEIRDLKNRLQLEAEFRQLAIKEQAAGDPKVALAIAKAERINKQANTAIDSYNTFAKVYNAFSSKNDLPIIGSKSRKDLAFDKIKNQAILDQKKALAGKMREEEKQARLKTREASYDYRQKKKADKEARMASQESQQSNQNESKSSTESKNNQSKKKANGAKKERGAQGNYDVAPRYNDIRDYVEEIRDIEVVQHPVETRPSRMLGKNSYYLEDKKKRK